MPSRCIERRSRPCDRQKARRSGKEAWGDRAVLHPLDLPEKPNTPIKGYWLAVYDRVGDEWKARVQIFNCAPPPPPQTSSAKQYMSLAEIAAVSSYPVFGDLALRAVKRDAPGADGAMGIVF